MTSPVTIRRKLEAAPEEFPEMAQFVGKEVVITVTELPAPGGDDEFPLRGTVLWFDDPDGPAVPEEEWDALR